MPAPPRLVDDLSTNDVYKPHTTHSSHRKLTANYGHSQSTGSCARKRRNAARYGALASPLSGKCFALKRNFAYTRAILEFIRAKVTLAGCGMRDEYVRLTFFLLFVILPASRFDHKTEMQLSKVNAFWTIKKYLSMNSFYSHKARCHKHTLQKN